MSDQPRAKKTQPSNDHPAGETPAEAPMPQEPPAGRPSLEHFDRWIQKRLVPAMGSVIVIAFLFKTFVPIQYGFSLGLLTGVVLLLAVYLIDFYRR